MLTYPHKYLCCDPSFQSRSMLIICLVSYNLSTLILLQFYLKIIDYIYLFFSYVSRRRILMIEYLVSIKGKKRDWRNSPWKFSINKRELAKLANFAPKNGSVVKTLTIGGST